MAMWKDTLSNDHVKIIGANQAVNASQIKALVKEQLKDDSAKVLVLTASHGFGPGKHEGWSAADCVISGDGDMAQRVRAGKAGGDAGMFFMEDLTTADLIDATEQEDRVEVMDIMDTLCDYKPNTSEKENRAYAIRRVARKIRDESCTVVVVGWCFGNKSPMAESLSRMQMGTLFSPQ